MRVCSLLPSATEIVADLGLIDSLVGVSEECAWPPEVGDKPRVTAAKIDSANLSSAEIERIVRASVGDGHSLYAVDAELIDELRPDVLITQDLCTVCAVSSGDLASACPVGGEVISLDPRTLSEVAETVTVLAERLSAVEAGRRIVAEMEGKIARVRGAVEGLPRRRVFVAEWIEPPYCAGHWVPEMVDAAGGRDVMGVHAEPSFATGWDAVIERKPEIVVVAPCGFDAEQAAKRAGDLRLPCRVVAVDADSYYSRPAPRLADGVLQLGHLIHPEAVVDPGLPELELGQAAAAT
jgi:iron complex transport system substrate-binding protein